MLLQKSEFYCVTQTAFFTFGAMKREKNWIEREREKKENVVIGLQHHVGTLWKLWWEMIEQLVGHFFQQQNSLLHQCCRLHMKIFQPFFWCRNLSFFRFEFFDWAHTFDRESCFKIFKISKIHNLTFAEAISFCVYHSSYIKSILGPSERLSKGFCIIITYRY